MPPLREASAGLLPPFLPLEVRFAMSPESGFELTRELAGRCRLEMILQLV